MVRKEIEVIIRGKKDDKTERESGNRVRKSELGVNRRYEGARDTQLRIRTNTHKGEEELGYREEEERTGQVVTKERMDKMQKMIIIMDEKIRKLEVMIDNMMSLHNNQMGKIISMFEEIQKGSEIKGKTAERSIVNYTDCDNDEYY